MCHLCNNKRYVIAERADGRLAVERCDACYTPGFTDEAAARLAIEDGVECSTLYPCVVMIKLTNGE